jgi:hypothetical protein
MSIAAMTRAAMITGMIAAVVRLHRYLRGATLRGGGISPAMRDF